MLCTWGRAARIGCDVEVVFNRLVCPPDCTIRLLQGSRELLSRCGSLGGSTARREGRRDEMWGSRFSFSSRWSSLLLAFRHSRSPTAASFDPTLTRPRPLEYSSLTPRFAFSLFPHLTFPSPPLQPSHLLTSSTLPSPPGNRETDRPLPRPNRPQRLALDRRGSQMGHHWRRTQGGGLCAD